MATKYIFNNNMLTMTGAPGSTVTFDIEGNIVRATCDKYGKARVNASPFYLALFADYDKNGFEEWTTELTLSNGDKVKYGYMGVDEDAEYGSLAYVPDTYDADSDCSPCQVKLRWLDHYGNWKYWVFERGTKGVTDANQGEMIPGMVGVVEYSTIRRPQMKSSAESLIVCAPNVDETTWMYLSELKKSIHVCMYGVNEWVPVVVSAGTSQWVRDVNRKKMQDFELTLNLPEYSISL